MNFPEHEVVIQRSPGRGYCGEGPYDPAERYPEYTGKSTNVNNHVYGAVRALLIRLKLDAANVGTSRWNPLGEFIRPGMAVFIKPNTVSHVNLIGEDLFSVIVHASILRPILDYVCKALEGRGRIVIGDSQVIFAEFEPAMQRSGIQELLEWYRRQTSIPIECYDLRQERGVRTYLFGKWGRKRVEQDPRGYQIVDLGEESYFRGIDPNRLRIAIASYKKMREYHGAGRHQYVFPRSFLESDVVINIPKLKTHRRTAVTLALKNYMGIPSCKDSLPHFITGSPEEGGDQYMHPSKRKALCLWMHDQIQASPYIPIKFVLAVLKKLVWNSSKLFPFPDDIYEAMWPGNDTLWRTLLDLNRIVTYADCHGQLRAVPQRRQFHLIDGIIGGEGDGPLSPYPVQAQVLLGGWNSVVMDAVATTIMGFDFHRIPLIQNGFTDSEHIRPVCRVLPAAVRVELDDEVLNLEQLKTRMNLSFRAHPNWVGHAELPTMAVSEPAAHGKVA